MFDLSKSSPPCRGPMNSVIATTKSAIYLAIKHIFPEVPINAGTFVPLHVRSRPARSLMRTIRGRYRDAPPKSASASPKRSFWLLPRRCRRDCSPRPPARAATSR